MDYQTLAAELAKPAYAAMTDAEAADVLNAATETAVVSRFGSLRTLAAILTPEEYAAVRSALDAAAGQSVVVADMLAMLKLPGDDQGNGGGIDLGNAAVRVMLDQLCTPAVAAKIKAWAESVTHPWSVSVSEVEIARGSRAAVQQEPDRA